MFVALWEFEVKPGCQKRFQKVYSPGGDWATLFRNDANYQETRLLHDPAHPAIFRTLDFWTSRQAYESSIASHAAEYQRLDAVGEELTRRERKIGWFESVEHYRKSNGNRRSENRTGDQRKRRKPAK
jgi:quinol monooxygenase YgiN